MGPVRMLAGSEIRRHWVRVVALTLLVGVVGAVLLATGAGAHRSGSALRRFNAYSRTSDIEIDTSNPTPMQLRSFGRVPEVTEVAVLHAYALSVMGSTNLPIAAAVDNKLGTVVDRALLIAGRRADQGAADEITIGEGLAASAHLALGSYLDAASMTPEQIAKVENGGGDPGRPAGPRLRWRVVGIVRRPIDLGNRAASGVIVLTPAFDRAYFKRVGLFVTVLRVRTLHDAADLPLVSAAARQIFGGSAFFKVVDLASERLGPADAINVLTLALWIFAAVAGLAGAVAIGIVLSREISQATTDQATLRALGLTHRQRIAASTASALLIAGGGALLAFLGAIVASPLLPTGIARRSDPDPGLHADWFVLGPGLAAIAAFVLLVALVAAFRATQRRPLDRPAPARLGGKTIVDIAAHAGLRPTVTNGLRMALQRGRDRTAVPVRSALFGAAFGVVGITAVLVFASSLTHLAATPRLYGWTWDFKAPDDTFTNPCNRNDFGLRSQPGVADVAAVCYQPMQIDGRPVTGWGFTPLRGTIAPEILTGRAPRTPDEVALGSTTLHALGKKIGDTVRVRGPKATYTYRIVGRTVLPRLLNSEIQPLADGATFTGDGFLRILDRTNATRYLVGRFASGADRAAVEHRLDAIPAFQPTTAAVGFTNDRGAAGPTVPPEIERLRQVNWFPPALATLLALLALVAVGHALVTSVRRRRRELALLKTLGFDRGQIRATVAWQATTLAAIGLLVGIPIGLAVGNLVWHRVAGSIGVSTSAAIPLPTALLVIPASLALINAIAAIPARTAARTRPAVALRTE